MYQSLLTRRYLTTKVMPLLSVLAVIGCTSTVLIVWSIMGGFLTVLLESGRSMLGDVSIRWPTAGFAYYDDLVDRLEEDELVLAATPVVQQFGMINLPDDRVLGVEVMGIDGPSFARVTGYAESLWWKQIDEPLSKDPDGLDPRLGPNRSDDLPPDFTGLGQPGRLDAIYEQGLNLEEPDPDSGLIRPAVVLGIELSGYSERQPGGWYLPAPGVLRRTETGGYEAHDGFIVDQKITLNVLPVDRSGRGISVVSRRLPVANEFRSGVFEFDGNTVLIQLEELQRMLKMDEGERIIEGADDPFSGFDVAGSDRPGSAGSPQFKIEPARVTTVLVKGVEGVDPLELRERCQLIYRSFELEHMGEVPTDPDITTFAQQQQTLVAAVQKETALVLGILIFISLVVSFLILSIFWSMVSEKTRDIGILRSLGASRIGVAWLWLRYGLVIGVVGSIFGAALATAIVWNINPIHDWLGRAFSLTIWDPRVYYLFQIPNDVEPVKGAVVLIGGVVLSVLGALIPAVRAAWMDPVRALRFE